jgi:hypothetical protein
MICEKCGNQGSLNVSNWNLRKIIVEMTRCQCYGKYRIARFDIEQRKMVIDKELYGDEMG